MGSWSDIPAHLLCVITKKLSFADVVRSGAVCSWWSSIPFSEKYSPNSQIPWLMFSPKSKINSRYMYSMTEKKSYEFILPSIAGQRCYGSSHGYLFSLDANADLVAINPLAPRSCIPLPPTSSFFWSVVRGPSTSRITDYGKAILSPDRTTAVVYIRFDKSHCFACSGDKRWRPLHIVDGLQDFIFHKGDLCAVTSTGTLFIYDLSCGLIKPYESAKGPGPGYSYFGVYDEPRTYLVESPCGEHLFLVFRLSKWVGRQEETCKFKVFKLDKATTTRKWKRINSLGDISFFLGFNNSMALCVRELPSFKKNCIYFTNDATAYPSWNSDNGVFSFDDRSVKPLYEDDDNLDPRKWLQPVWFMPTML